MVARGQVNFFPKARVVVPVYDKMAPIMPHSFNLSEIEKILYILRKFFKKQKNRTIAKYRAHYRFLLRGQNVFSSVIRT